MAKETVALAVHGRTEPNWLTDGEAVHLLDARPVAGLAANAATRELRVVVDFLAGQRAVLDALATRRAEALLADHCRLREAARDVGQYSVRPVCRWMYLASTCCCRANYDVQYGVQIGIGD